MPINCGTQALETVWSDGRLDTSRTRLKRDVATGYVRFQSGDILCPKVTPTFQAGRAALLDSLPCSVGVASTEVHVLRARSRTDARFVRYALLSTGFLEEGVSRFQGVAGLQRVPEEFIRQFKVICTSLDQQQRIADLLDQETSRIEQVLAVRQKQLDLLGRRTEAIAFELVTGASKSASPASSSVPWPIPWVPKLPDTWPALRICQVARMGTGHTPSRSEPAYWVDCTIPWLTTADVHKFRADEIDTIHETEFRISQLGLANSAAVKHPAGTVALSRTASAGFAIVMGTEMATSQDFATWTPGPDLDPHFLLWCLRAMRRDIMGRLATGSTHKTIYFPDLMSIRIPLPPLGEQRRIVARAQTLHEQGRAAQEALTRSIALLQERKRSLITAAVTGELDVTAATQHAGVVR